MVARCRCDCHDAAAEDGVDVRDPVEAVLACAVCINDHCEALLDDPPSKPLPRGDTYTAWVPDPADPINPEGRE